MKAHEPTEEAAQPNCRRRRSPVPNAALIASSGVALQRSRRISHTAEYLPIARGAQVRRRRHRLEPAHQQLEGELEALVGVARR